MTSAPQQTSLLSRIADGCALVVAVTALVVMAGWVAGYETVKRILPQLESMKFNAALGLLLAAKALWRRDRPQWRVTLGLLVAMLGALSLTESLTGFDFGMDQFIVRDLTAVPGTEPLRVSTVKPSDSEAPEEPPMRVSTLKRREVAEPTPWP